MRIRLLKPIGTAVTIAAVLVFLKPIVANEAGGAPLKTPWGEPDLQGIWTDESDTPLQRPAKYANQEFFTEAQRQELDKERSALLRRDPHVLPRRQFRWI